MPIKKLFVTDLDGTFLRSDHSFDRQGLRSILNQFKENGYLFVAASGRSLLSLENVFKGYEEDMAFLAENGSLLSYQGQMIFEDKPIEPEVYLHLIKELNQGPFHPASRLLLSAKKNAYVLDSVDEDYYQRIVHYYPNLNRLRDFSDIQDEIIKIVVSFPEDKVESANQWLNQHFEGVSAVTTGFDSIDIILSDINKAVALSQLCQHFGLTNEDVIAFGDNQNDMEMLDFAGTAIATENARPIIKKIADLVIGNCDDDAVIRFMQDFLEK